MQENEFLKHVLPTLPFMVKNNEQRIQQDESNHNARLWTQEAPLSKDEQYFPLSFKKKGDSNYWTLPYETHIHITGKNTIIKRYIAKRKNPPHKNLGKFGSVKEHWNTDDYKIIITGVLLGAFTNGVMRDCYPIEDFQRLNDYLTSGESIEVYCPPLELLNIHRVVIESVEYPFKKGENVLAYKIQCYSDIDYAVLLDLNNE